ncbi:MAG: hypothetical protein JOZ69_19270 [Myxococcales bacterium]|nr:hypothetical protein [Myxococcales bacterium]
MRIALHDPAAASLEGASTAPPPTTPAAALPSSTPSGPSFADVLRGIGRTLGDGEATMRAAVSAASSAGDLGPSARLIALQAGVYRYSEAVDLSSRLVDRTTSGVKTVLQGAGQ